VPKPPRVTRTREIPVERDADGFPLCRQCKTSIRTGKRPKQRTFCDDKNCLHLWQLRSNTTYQVRHVLERDKGVCAFCFRDCLALLASLQLLAQTETRRLFGVGKTAPLTAWRHRPANVHPLPGFAGRCAAIKLPSHLRGLNRRLWDMDHVVPVIEGGGSCGLENLRTLCWSCHASETAALAARRAEARRAG
jgi:5-methylcytosine-specific restriction enzyme A